MLTETKSPKYSGIFDNQPRNNEQNSRWDQIKLNMITVISSALGTSELRARINSCRPYAFLLGEQAEVVIVIDVNSR